MLMKAVVFNLIMEKLVSKELFPAGCSQGLCIVFVAMFFLKYGFLAVESLPFHKMKSKVNKMLQTFNFCDLITTLFQRAIFNHSCIFE